MSAGRAPGLAGLRAPRGGGPASQPLAFSHRKPPLPLPRRREGQRAMRGHGGLEARQVPGLPPASDGAGGRGARPRARSGRPVPAQQPAEVERG